MKRLIALLILTPLAICCFSQQPDPEKGTKAYYQQKSKNQKTAARVLIIGGPILIGAGFLIGDRKESTFSDAAMGAVVGGVGVLSCIGSIPLFLASARNAEKAKSVSFHLQLESTHNFLTGRFSPKVYPALSFRLSL